VVFKIVNLGKHSLRRSASGKNKLQVSICPEGYGKSGELSLKCVYSFIPCPFRVEGPPGGVNLCARFGHVRRAAALSAIRYIL